jgi:hypothetical protein
MDIDTRGTLMSILPRQFRINVVRLNLIKSQNRNYQIIRTKLATFKVGGVECCLALKIVSGDSGTPPLSSESSESDVWIYDN